MGILNNNSGRVKRWRDSSEKEIEKEIEKFMPGKTEGGEKIKVTASLETPDPLIVYTAFGHPKQVEICNAGSGTPHIPDLHFSRAKKCKLVYDNGEYSIILSQEKDVFPDGQKDQEDLVK